MLRRCIDGRRCGAAVFVLLACGPSSPQSSGNETSTTAAADDGTHETSSTPTTATSLATSSSGSPEPATSSSSGDECSTTTPEACAPDLGTFACDVDAQDCPRGWKCAPHSEDDDPYPEDHRCVPLSPDPAATGEPCTIVGDAYSGGDDCELNAICVVADRIELTGICAPFCTYDEMPCPMELECTAISLGQYVCLPACDPLAQDCPPGQACYPFEPEYGRFNCLPHVGGAYGIECEINSDCGPGTHCAREEDVPGCSGERCCTTYCDASIPNPSIQCPDAGQICDYWYCAGAPEPSLENFGTCGAWSCN